MTPAGTRLVKILLTGALPIVGLALLGGLMRGPVWGWAVAALGFLLVVVMQTRRLLMLSA